MHFLQLFKNELGTNKKRFILFLLLSAFSSIAIVAIINSAITATGTIKIILSVTFIILLAAFVFGELKLLNLGWLTAEKITENFRERLSAKILNADVYELEKAGDKEIFERLTQETSNISQSAGFLIPSLQTIVFLVFILIYLAVIYPAGFAAYLVLIIAGLFLYKRASSGIMTLIKRSVKSEMRFYGFLNDILKGLKELKLSSAKKDSILGDINSASAFLRKAKQKSFSGYSDIIIYSQSFFFLIIGVIVFIIPRYQPDEAMLVVKLVTTAFFVMGPSLGMLFMLPVFEKTDLSIEYLAGFEEKLDAISEKHNENAAIAGIENTANIKTENLEFEYQELSGESFKAGPVSLGLKKGEIVFFTGSNGSGKTTLLKVISTLYKKTGGKIYLNDTEINNENLQSYRSIFSTVFSDFHLFAKLYALEQPDAEKVNAMLKKMGLESKTNYEENAFTRQDLSTGQRKRLALIITLLEDRPVMIFDEWAAEQDSHFREYFYREILPELKNKGKLLLVVSHDERYFNAADRIVKMEYGKISDIIIN